MDGLIIYKQPLDQILSGEKTLEVRGSDCPKHTKCFIALIEAGTGLIKGTAYLTGTFSCSLDQFKLFKAGHLVEYVPKYKKIWCWEIKHVTPFDNPIKYIHPQGAQTWVKDVL